MTAGAGREPWWARLLDGLRVPRRVHPQAPLALALMDHARTGRSRSVRALRPSGLEYEIDTAEFFDLGGEQSPIDEAIVEHARGRVLDVGAGAGRHALALQSRGHRVCAIDVSPICVDLLRARGVLEVREADVWDCVSPRAGAPGAPGIGGPRDERFDTVLFGMQSIGIAGTLAGLDALLVGLQGLLAPGGRVLLDSSAPIGADFESLFTFARFEAGDGTADEAFAVGGDDASDFAVLGRSDVPADRLAGEALVSFAYRSWRGRFFPWLYLGSEALAQAAERRGFRCEVLARAVDSPEYLAVLEPAVESLGGEAGDVYDPGAVPSAARLPRAGSPREGRS